MRKSIKLIILVIVFLGILMISNNVFAATADITIEDNDQIVNVGDTVEVTIKVNAAQWDVSVTANGLSYVSGTQRFTELDNAEGNLSKSTTVKYKADSAGEFNISLSGDVTDISGENSDVSKSAKLTVKEKETKPEEKPAEPETPTAPSTPDTPSTPTTPEKPVEKPKEKSNNAYLSTLGVRITADLAKELGVKTSEYDFSGFSKKKTEYNVTIPSNVDYLKVEYKTADANAKVKVEGNSGFEVGSNNKITINVTAEDGKTTETYTIKVTQLAEEEEKPGNVIDDDEGLYLTSLSLGELEISPVFTKDTYAYTANLIDSNATTINVNATANKADADIEISGNTNLVIGENTITIVVKDPNSSVQTVYQIILTKQEESVITTTTDTTGEDTNLMGNIIGSLNKYVIIAVGVVVLMIVLVIVLIILLRKENKRLKEENDMEYNVYEKDEDEFQKQEVQEEKIEVEADETETKNVRRKSRREKGKHSK